jgi:hypothetical protein
MILISHRGNIDGREPQRENNPDFILEAVKAGFDVEVDVWVIDSQYLLGHDEPQYEVNLEWLRRLPLWCHAKNKEAFTQLLISNIHCFWHENDRFTLTSKGIPWCFPNNYQKNGITVSLGIKENNFSHDILGVCTDYPLTWRNDIQETNHFGWNPEVVFEDWISLPK